MNKGHHSFKDTTLKRIPKEVIQSLLDKKDHEEFLIKNVDITSKSFTRDKVQDWIIEGLVLGLKETNFEVTPPSHVLERMVDQIAWSFKCYKDRISLLESTIDDIHSNMDEMILYEVSLRTGDISPHPEEDK